MSLSTLTSPTPEAATRARKGLPSWTLPAGLLLGFAGVFLLLFGERLLPSVKVTTAQVVTLRSATSSTSSSSQNRELLFQASGWLEPDPYSVHVPALVNGVVAEVHVLEGDSVKAGELLATLIDDEAKLSLEQAERNLTTIRSRIAAHCSTVPELNARVETARAKVEAEKARLAELSDNANRLQSLPEGAASTAEITAAMLRESRQKSFLLEAESEIPRLQAQLTTVDFERVAMGNGFLEAESARDLAKLALDRHRITAPIDGRILHLHAQPGKKRMLDMDDPKSALIVELYQPELMQARIDVPLNEAANLALEQEVELTTDLLNDVTMHGRVTRITGEADIARNTLQVKVALTDPDDRLRPEMLVRAKFYPPLRENPEPLSAEAGEKRLLILAPEKALLDVDGRRAKAWVVDADSKAQLRDLILGSTSRDAYREVKEGLRSGEKLILPPFSELQSGARVNPLPL